MALSGSRHIGFILTQNNLFFLQNGLSLRTPQLKTSTVLRLHWDVFLFCISFFFFFLFFNGFTVLYTQGGTMTVNKKKAVLKDG